MPFSAGSDGSYRPPTTLQATRCVFRRFLLSSAVAVPAIYQSCSNACGQCVLLPATYAGVCLLGLTGCKRPSHDSAGPVLA